MIEPIPWHNVVMDIVFEFTSSYGYIFILVVTTLFSKMLCLILLTEETDA